MKTRVYHLTMAEDRMDDRAVREEYVKIRYDANLDTLRSVVARGTDAAVFFENVAVVDGDLETAWMLTQNRRDSWSIGNGQDRSPRVTVTPEGERRIVEQDGYGLRSSDLGDLFVNEAGEVFMCATIGFNRIDGLKL